MMRQPAKVLTPATAVLASAKAKAVGRDYVRMAERFNSDSDKQARKSRHQCKTCWYILGKVGGAAMTVRPCACCAEEQTYGSTCTDVLCLKCAKEHELCAHCGGDIDMRERRKKPFPNKP